MTSSVPAANRRTEITHPAAFTARMLFFTSAALVLISTLQFTVSDRNQVAPILSILDVTVIIAGIAGAFFGYRHMGKFTIPAESPADFSDVRTIVGALERQSIGGKDNVIIQRRGIGHFLLTLIPDVQLVAMSSRIRGIATTEAKRGSRAILITIAILLWALFSPRSGPALPYLAAGVAWSGFYIWVMLYLRSWGGRSTTRHMGSSMVEGAGHPQTLFQTLENRARSLQNLSGPVRVFSKQPLMQAAGVNDTGKFDSFLLYEEPPDIQSNGSPAQFGTMTAPLAAIGAIACIWILHTELAAASENADMYFLVISALLLCISALRLCWKLDSIFRFSSNVILVEMDGTYSQSKVRIGKSVYDSNESENTATRSDIRINYFAAEAWSETPHILKPRELSALAASPRAAQLIETFRSDAETFTSKGVAPIGIRFEQPAASEITGYNLKVMGAQAGIRASVTAAGAMPLAMPARPVEVPARLIESSEDTKVCPDCAETIKAAARKCRFCGRVFEA